VRWLYDYAWFVGFLVSAAFYLLLMYNAAPAVERVSTETN
jgi:cytosine/uracil/thiamine/allantoin permease